MGSQIPPEVMNVLGEFRDSLKKFNTVLKEFTSVPFEEMQSVCFKELIMIKIIFLAFINITSRSEFCNNVCGKYISSNKFAIER